MPIYQFPDNQDKRKPKEVVEPEVILVDDREEEINRQKFSEELIRVKKIQLPIYIRLIFLLLGGFSLLWALGSLLICSCSSLLAALTFNRFPAFEKTAITYFISFKRAAICALGLIVAFFSPPLGLGMVLMFFMMQGSGMNEGIFSRMMRSNLKDYIHPE